MEHTTHTWLYRGNQPQSESGNIRFEDMRDSNLLKYTAETGETLTETQRCHN